MTNLDISIQFFLQLAVILTVCYGVAAVARYFGQPKVTSEMIAGVLIGPSLLGMLFPELQSALFPKPTMTVVYSVAQLGLVLYMFLVGCEFDLDLIRNRARSAVSVSLAGIAAPFALGIAAASMLSGDTRFFSAETTRVEAMLFLGASMSITAFPMLARIIYERGLAGTSLGTLALAAGSSDDAAAWCILAIVLASFGGDPMIAVVAVGGGIGYAVLVLKVVRPMLVPLGRLVEKHKGLTAPTLGFVLILLMLGAWWTDYIRIYAVFGAFIMGLAMPRGLLTAELQRVFEPLVVNLLLPLFFVYSGLNTQIGLAVGSGYMWAITLMLLAFACLGKFGGCYVAARLNRETHREAMGIATLMNARGLMELIILNIGLERGIITPTLFTMMVIMAIVTTLMASPMFDRVYLRSAARAGSVPLGATGH
ncbi:MAG: cation:proton antiporter [Gemmatimonadetes bacterium]|nr:cation:proton antiporter [Gemmatimonadota bacterium]